MLGFRFPARWDPPLLDLPATSLDALIIAQHESLIASSVFERCYIYWNIVPLVLLVILFMAPRPTKPLRVFAWAVISSCYFYYYYFVRPRPSPILFALNFMSVFFYFRVTSLMLFENPQANFKRLVRVRYRRLVQLSDQQPKPGQAGPPQSLIGSETTVGLNDQAIRQMCSSQTKTSYIRSSEDVPLYAWQAFPDDIPTRFWWVVDMLFSFRGVTWNWMPPDAAVIPSWVRSQFPSGDFKDSPQGVFDPNPLNTSFSRDVFMVSWFVRTGIVLAITDLVLEATFYDSTFYGGRTSAPEYFLSPHYLAFMGPLLVSQRFVAFYRWILITTLLVGYGASFFALCEFCFTVLPELPFFIIRRLDQFGLLHSSTVFEQLRDILLKAGDYMKNMVGVYAEPWTIPYIFGPADSLITRGFLTGFWGSWWQQMAKYGFIRPADELVAYLELTPSSNIGKSVRCLVTFVLSGVLHLLFGALYGNASDPWKRLFMPFIWQPIGMELQKVLLGRVQTMRLSISSQRFVIGVFSFLWLFWTTFHVYMYAIDCGITAGMRNIGLIRLLGVKPRADSLISEVLTRTVYWAPESKFVLTGLAI